MSNNDSNNNNLAAHNLIKSFSVIGAGTMINLLLGLLNTPIITRIISTSEYGEYSIYTVYISIGVSILLLGLDQGIIRFFHETNDSLERHNLLVQCVVPGILTVTIAFICALILNALGVLHVSFSIQLICLMFCELIVSIFHRFGMNIARLEYRSKLYAIAQVVHKAVFIVVAIGLLLLVEKRFEMLAVASLISVLVAFFLFYFSQRQYWKFENILSCKKVFNKELIKYSFPLMIATSVTTVFNAIDKLSLDYFCTKSDVGIYSSAMALVNIFAILQTTFTTIWMPTAIEHYAKSPEKKTFYIKANKIITVCMFLCGLTLILCKDIFAYILGPEYREAAYILPFLIFHPIMYTVSETTVSGINFLKKSKYHIVISIASCMINLVGNMVLIPIVGAKGAAISTGLSYVIFFTLRTVLSNRLYPVQFPLLRFYILTFVTVIFAGYNTFYKFSWITIAMYIICIFALVILYRDAIKDILHYAMLEWKQIRKK